MTTSNIIVIGFALALLSIVSFMLLKHSSKEYPPKKEEPTLPKFKPRKVTDLSKGQVVAEQPTAPKKKNYRKNYKKKPVATPKKSE
jgi:hypothetical protein